MILNDKYVCDVCNCTFHWSCLLELGCYKDEDQESVKMMKPGPALLVLASLFQRNSITSLKMRSLKW